jgi:hypothetical protein
METRKMMVIGLLMAGLALLIGCSNQSPTDPGIAQQGGIDPGNVQQGEMAQQASMNLTDPPNLPRPYAYPPKAYLPPAGHKFLQRNPKSPILEDDLYATMMINRAKGGTLWLDRNFICILAWAIPHSQWISICQPNPAELIIDFETHGLTFSGPQLARISYVDYIIPPGLLPEDLMVWYWNSEIGVYEFIGGVNNTQAKYIDFNINHFSRYVVAGPDM